jgi:hypothetical protein
MVPSTGDNPSFPFSFPLPLSFSIFFSVLSFAFSA